MPQSPATALRAAALDAFARRTPDCAAQLSAALEHAPHDGALLLAEAAARAERGDDAPFARLEAVLVADPSWSSGHRALAQLKIEFGEDRPLATLERALAARPNDPSLWHGYLNLLAALGDHAQAADKTAELRGKVGNVAPLRLLEARYAGLAGDPQRGAALLEGLPADLPDLAYQRARNALQRGAVEEAETILAGGERGRAIQAGDMRTWAMRELCWRALGGERHPWLIHEGKLVTSCDLDLTADAIARISGCLRALHRTRLAPPSQSLRGGTQTRGHLHLRDAPELKPLFGEFAEALASYSARTKGFGDDHPLSVLANRTARMEASWSVRLSRGGFHVPHLHDTGLISSACHIVVPQGVAQGEGLLELGRPPADIALEMEPIASFMPQPGRLILFPSFLYHSTTPFGAGERLSAVFDAR